MTHDERGEGASWIVALVGLLLLALTFLAGSDSALFGLDLAVGLALLALGAFDATRGRALAARPRAWLQIAVAVLGLVLAFLWLVTSENVSLRPIVILLALVALGIGAYQAWVALRDAKVT